MRDIILFGVQGSGKGTQGRIIAEQHGCEIFEMGKALRALADEPSELGRKVKSIIEAGNLVSDEVVIEALEDFLAKRSGSVPVVFDGLPRKLSQKDLFEEVMKKFRREPLGVFIRISDEEALRRLGNRWMSRSTGKIYAGKSAALQECEESDVYQRSDDTPEAIRVRLRNYHRETQPVIDWYQQQGRLIEVDGEADPDEVSEVLEQRIFS